MRAAPTGSSSTASGGNCPTMDPASRAPNSDQNSSPDTATTPQAASHGRSRARARPSKPNGAVPRCNRPNVNRARAATAKGCASPRVSRVSAVHPELARPKRHGEPVSVKRSPRQSVRLAM